MPPAKVSGGSPSGRAPGGRRRKIKAITAIMHRLMARKTEALLHQASMAPARAGPRARVALMEIPLRDTADGTCSRGMTPTRVTIQAAMPRALPPPRMKVNNSSDQVCSSPCQASRLSAAEAPSMAACVSSSRRRGSMRSASTPPGRPSRKTGNVIAVCTRETISGDADSWVMIQAAATVCIQIAMLAMAQASHNPTNNRWRSGAQNDEVCAGVVEATCRCLLIRQSAAPAARAPAPDSGPVGDRYGCLAYRAHRYALRPDHPASGNGRPPAPRHGSSR